MLTICICNQFWNKCHSDIEQLTQNISVHNKKLNQQFLSACLFGLFQPRSQERGWVFFPNLQINKKNYLDT